jgi:[acyl-carrier-protein] S-malonyltransferase
MSQPALAFLFPGQGSQSVGMLSQLAVDCSEVTATFGEASDLLGRDLWRLASDGPEEVLGETQTTQPVMLAAGVAVWRCWQGRGGAMPAAMAGHSLGEYTALVCAGALSFGDAVDLVAERARLMQEAVPIGQGAMAAVLGLDDDQVAELCAVAAEGEVLEAVNFNAPGQVVVAGAKTAVERAVANAKSAGAKRALMLPVSVPSHCTLMRDAAAALAERLASVELSPPAIPVLHNVTAEPAASMEDLRGRLSEQLYSPVQWVRTVRALAGRGVQVAVEAGPGKVLTGLNKRIDKTLKTLPVFDGVGLSQALQETTHA